MNNEFIKLMKTSNPKMFHSFILFPFLAEISKKYSVTEFTVYITEMFISRYVCFKENLL